MLPAGVNKKSFHVCSRIFSYAMYWGENLLLLVAFLLYEFLILFLTYLKVYLNIIRASEGLFTKIFFVGVWMF